MLVFIHLQKHFQIKKKDRNIKGFNMILGINGAKHYRNVFHRIENIDLMIKNVF